MTKRNGIHHGTASNRMIDQSANTVYWMDVPVHSTVEKSWEDSDRKISPYS